MSTMRGKIGSPKLRARALRRHPKTVEPVAAGQAWAPWQFILVLVVGLIFCSGVASELDLFNEAWAKTGWWWAWRELGIVKTGLLLFPPFLLVAWVVRRFDRRPDPARVWLYVSLLALANYLLQLFAMLANPQGMEWLRAIVFSPMATSYFNDAMAIRHPLGWLRQFHQIGLGVHSSTHPPGPILFYYVFIKLFGASRGALLGGCAVGLFGSAGVLVMYLFSGLWTADVRSRIGCCSWYALLPALVIFFPEFDQTFPILSMLLIFFIVRAFRAAPNLTWDAVYAGAMLFLALFFAYNLLATGVFLIYFGLYWLWNRRSSEAWAAVARISCLFLGVYAAMATSLWLATGYNPIAAFRTALHKQGLLAAYVHRSYRAFAMMDPYDFLLGAGIIALPIVIFYVSRLWKSRFEHREELALSIIGLATILTVDVSGLLRAESARVWLFLQPLLIVPAGIELARVSWQRKRWILMAQWLILVCLQAKMSFVAP